MNNDAINQAAYFGDRDSPRNVVNWNSPKSRERDHNRALMEFRDIIRREEERKREFQWIALSRDHLVTLQDEI